MGGPFGLAFPLRPFIPAFPRSVLFVILVDNQLIVHRNYRRGTNTHPGDLCNHNNAKQRDAVNRLPLTSKPNW